MRNYKDLRAVFWGCAFAALGSGVGLKASQLFDDVAVDEAVVSGAISGYAIGSLLVPMFLYRDEGSGVGCEGPSRDF